MKKYKIVIMEYDFYGYLTLTNDLKDTISDKSTFDSQEQNYLNELIKNWFLLVYRYKKLGHQM